jgi:hypothetical protein
MTDRAGSAAGTRLLALGTSVAATLALMGGMAAAAPDAATVTSTPASVDQQRPGAAPRLTPTTAPPTTSSHAS